MPPRYDVLNPDANPDDPGSIGPYCDNCYMNTYTYAEASKPAEPGT